MQLSSTIKHRPHLPPSLWSSSPQPGLRRTKSFPCPAPLSTLQRRCTQDQGLGQLRDPWRRWAGPACSAQPCSQGAEPGLPPSCHARLSPARNCPRDAQPKRTPSLPKPPFLFLTVPQCPGLPFCPTPALRRTARTSGIDGWRRMSQTGLFRGQGEAWTRSSTLLERRVQDQREEM